MTKLLSWILWTSVGSIFYTYAGYPLLLSAFARLAGRRSSEEPAFRDADLPTATLIVAAYNEQDAIARKLENSLSLEYPFGRLQILVAADGSSDGTTGIVRSFAQRGVDMSYRSGREGKAAAINHAVAQARGEVIVFSDANNDYDPNAIRELARPFADPTVGGVVGAKHVFVGDGPLSDSEGLYWRYESYVRRMESSLGSCTGAVGEIFAIRRDLFESLPKDIVCDDFYMAARLLRRGYRVVYRPEAKSRERISVSATDERKRRAKIVAGRYQAIALAHRLLPIRRPLLAWQMLSHKFMRPFVPFAMAAALIANVLLATTPSRGYRLLLAGQLGFYSLAALGAYVRSDTKIARLLYLPTFLVQSNLAAFMGLYRYLAERETMHLWERVARRT